MTEGPKKNEWTTPQTILATLGMMAAIAGAWMSFDSRITRVEQASDFSNARFDRIESKLDRLIERGNDK